MDHHQDVNPNAHPVLGTHLSNPMIIIHASLMFLAYGILMPIGIMLGIRRHKYHVPWNAAMFLVAMAGYFFGYTHHIFGPGGGDHDPDAGDDDHTENPAATEGDMAGMPMAGMRLRRRGAGDTSAEHYGLGFKGSAHENLATILLLLLFVQVGMGVYRKLTKTRPRLQLAWLSGALPKNIHSYLGKAHLVLAYIQITLGFIKLLEACPGQAFGQCISHIVMGGSFWWYGGIYIAYLVGSFPGVTRPEYYESLVMTVWGVINFSALHQWGTRWSHADLQHTSLGLLWVGGGGLSLFLESKYSPLAQFLIRKNPLPALLIILTGYAMGQHAQYYAFATTVHTFFGYCLMLGGICRLVQLALRPAVSPLAQDGDDEQDNVKGLAKGETSVSAFFGFLSAVGIISAGLLFQSAHEEQLNIVMYYLTDPSTYVNWVMSLAFISVAFMLGLSQAGKKLISASTPAKSYNRISTRADHSEDHSVSNRDIEMSGFLDREE